MNSRASRQGLPGRPVPLAKIEDDIWISDPENCIHPHYCLAEATEQATSTASILAKDHYRQVNRQLEATGRRATPTHTEAINSLAARHPGELQNQVSFLYVYCLHHLLLIDLNN